MAATLPVICPTTPMIAGYLRVGHTGHRKLADLHAAGRLPYRRLFFDAAHLAEQLELAKTLKTSGFRRASHFLLRHLDPAIRTARHAAKLKIADDKVLAALGQAKVRMVRLRGALADLDAKGTGDTRSRAPNFRGGTKAVSAVLGR